MIWLLVAGLVVLGGFLIWLGHALFAERDTPTDWTEDDL